MPCTAISELIIATLLQTPYKCILEEIQKWSDNRLVTFSYKKTMVQWSKSKSKIASSATRKYYCLKKSLYIAIVIVDRIPT